MKLCLQNLVDNDGMIFGQLLIPEEYHEKACELLKVIEKKCIELCSMIHNPFLDDRIVKKIFRYKKIPVIECKSYFMEFEADIEYGEWF